MSLKHLSNSDLEALQTRGLAGLSEEGLTHLALPDGYGMPSGEPQQALPLAQQPTKSGPTQWTGEEEGITPLTPVQTVAPLAKLGLEKAAEKSADVYAQGGTVGKIAGGLGGIGALTAQEMIPANEAEVGAQFLGGKALGALGKGIQALKTRGARKTMAQGFKAMAAIPEKSSMEVLADPSILKRALPVEEATANYVKTIPGLKDVVSSLKQKMGTNIPELGDYKKLIDQTEQLAKSGQAGAQDILDGVQAINEFFKRKDFAKAPGVARQLGELKQGFIDLLDQANPGFKSANRALRESYIAQDFNTWLPQNKNMSPNVLRTLFSVHNLLQGLSGNPSKLAAGLSGSPKVIGKAIQAGAFLGQDVRMPGLGGLFGRAAVQGGEEGLGGMGSKGPTMPPEPSGPTFTNLGPEKPPTLPVEGPKPAGLMGMMTPEAQLDELSPKIQEAGQALMDAEAKFGVKSTEAEEAHQKLHDLKNIMQKLILKAERKRKGL